jgi:SulP family sulfate permease
MGVVLSAVLYLYTSSTDISVVELVEQPDGRIEERKPPKHLRSNTVTVLDVYGHLFYAGARSLSRLLPRPQEAVSPVVILRLRGRTSVGATLIDELSTYAKQLAEVNGQLYLTGLSEDVYDQMVRTGKLRKADPVLTYKATSIVGESTHRAYTDAQTWLVSASDEAMPEEPPSDATAPDVIERTREAP